MRTSQRIKKIFKETLLVQVVVCLIYLLIFFIDSARGATLGDVIILIIIAIIPIFLTKYYIKSDKQETEKVKRFILTSIIWIIENTIIVFGCFKIAPGWWPLTYAIFIGYITITPIVFILICKVFSKVISYLYHKINN